jgi:predicted acylesterase/phospholipase RssA
MARTPVLYFAPLPHSFAELLDSTGAIPWLEVAPRETTRSEWYGPGLQLEIDVVSEAEEAARRLENHHYTTVVVDCRHYPVAAGDAVRQERALLRFLDLLEAERDRERRYSLARVVVLVGDADEERVDRLIFALGQRHVGACLRDLSLSPRLVDGDRQGARARFLDKLWNELGEITTGRRRGHKALCAAGGGVAGVFYELGVLKCLHDAFRNMDIRDFDMYFGISAGAVLGALVANGFAIDELLQQFSPASGPAMDLQIGVNHLNLGELPARARLAGKRLREYADRVRGRRDRFSLAGAATQLAPLLAPLFDSDELEQRLARILSQPGHTNDFRRLKRRLYIGATDQDLREHVLFGEPGLCDAPISRAVQASSAIHPFFRSVEIGGRYYTDGFITRSSNLISAIEHGADLVLIVDPFLPLIAEEPGTNSLHGNLWVVLQDYKTVAYSRFEQVSEAVLRQHPDVSCYTFVPSNRMRKLMALSPIANDNYDRIVTEAYCSTYRRLRQLEFKFIPDLETHGIEVSLELVGRRASAIAATRTPRVQQLFD